jgi:hypothetical protein
VKPDVARHCCDISVNLALHIDVATHGHHIAPDYFIGFYGDVAGKLHHITLVRVGFCSILLGSGLGKG